MEKFLKRLDPQIPRVKICCIQSIEEAHLAVYYGASALGLVSDMPGGPGIIRQDLILEIVSTVPPSVATFLLTSRQNVPEIIEQQKFCRTNTIQICDRLISGTHADLKKALPGISVVQVIHVTGQTSVAEACSVAENVDGLLLDSGNPAATVKELGGTGRRHDWSISRDICRLAKVPVFLAGGLKPENVNDAIRQVRPFGVDVCSGVRTDNALDEDKLKRFFAQVSGLH